MSGNKLNLLPQKEAVKEAVVFILDSNPSMLQPYRAGNIRNNGDDGDDNVEPPTRLHAAKMALESMLFEMMFNSQAGKTTKTSSFVSVIVTKTKATKHHLLPQDGSMDDDEEPTIFPNLTELRYEDYQENMDWVMHFPSAQMIRDMWDVVPVESQEEANAMQGDIIDALILGADALYRMTVNPKTKTPHKFRRKIVILTDAGHPIQLDCDQLLYIIDSLRNMHCCPLHVLGMGFHQETIEYETMLNSEAAAAIKVEPSPIKSNKRLKRDPFSDDDDDDSVLEDNDDPMPDVIPSDEYPKIEVYNNRQDREKLLASIAEKTGGSVASIPDLQALLDAKGGQRTKRATGSNHLFHLGPELTVTVKCMKLMQAKSTPRILSLFENAKGEMEIVKREYGHFRRLRPDEEEAAEEDQDEDAEGELIHGVRHEEVEVKETSNAIRYGKNLIPLDTIERDALKGNFGFGYDDTTVPDPQKKSYVRVIGCASPSAVPQRYLLGPPYLMSGKDSQRACTLVAAVARTLHQLDFVAIASMKSSPKGTPCLAVLIPFQGEKKKEKTTDPPNRLLLFKLPFVNEVKNLNFKGFTELLRVAEDDSDDDDDEAGNKNDEEYMNANTQAKAQIKKDKAQARAIEIKTKEEASDALVDAMMLDSQILRSDKIRSPYVTSFNKTLQRRVKEADSKELVTVPRGGPGDPMMTPPEVVQKAQPELDEFRKVFPLIKKKIKKPGARKKKGVPTYADHLDD